VPSSNGTRAITATPSFAAGGKQLVLGSLVEDVVDHLHGVDQAGAQRAQAVLRLPAIDADAHGATSLSLFSDRHGALPALVVGPRVVPGVELQEIERVDADVLEVFSANSRM
jgi:hypothetical protein